VRREELLGTRREYESLMMHSVSRSYDLVAAGLAATLSVVEVIRMLLAGGVTRGYTMLSTLIGGITFSAILAVAAFGLILHRSLGWLFGVLGFLAAASHGIIVCAGGNRFGVVYILGSAVLLGLMIKSLRFYRTETSAET